MPFSIYFLKNLSAGYWLSSQRARETEIVTRHKLFKIKVKVIYWIQPASSPDFMKLERGRLKEMNIWD